MKKLILIKLCMNLKSDAKLRHVSSLYKLPCFYFPNLLRQLPKFATNQTNSLKNCPDKCQSEHYRITEDSLSVHDDDLA